MACFLAPVYKVLLAPILPWTLKPSFPSLSSSLPATQVFCTPMCLYLLATQLVSPTSRLCCRSIVAASCCCTALCLQYCVDHASTCVHHASHSQSWLCLKDSCSTLLGLWCTLLSCCIMPCKVRSHTVAIAACHSEKGFRSGKGFMFHGFRV